MVVPAVHSWFDAIVVSLTAALMTFLSFIPAIIGAAIILVVGWILSGIVAKLVVKVLDRVGFNHAAERVGAGRFMTNAGVRNTTAADVAGLMVMWFIRLIFLEAAAQALHLTAVTELLNRILFFIPNLAVALIVVMIGALIARVAKEAVQGTASTAGFSNAPLLGKAAQVAIIGFAVIVAVNQIGVASSLINILFIAIVGSLALAIGLAFGLGGRDTAGQMVQKWYLTGQQAAPRLKAAAQQQAATQAAAAPAPTVRDPQVNAQPGDVPPAPGQQQRRWRVE